MPRLIWVAAIIISVTPFEMRHITGSRPALQDRPQLALIFGARPAREGLWGGLLARIIHEASTAAADPGMSAALRRLATNLHE